MPAAWSLPNLLAAEEIPLNAESLSRHGGLFGWLTNSILLALIVTGLIVWACRRATAKMALVPSRPTQNLFEALIEFLYSALEGVVGTRMIARAFPLLATFFLFIVAANIVSLIPGVGTIGFGPGHGFLSVEEMQTPLFRPANADLNLTLGMALLFTVLWIYWTVQEAGVWGFLLHTFGPKGGLKGSLVYFLAPIFFFVGIIEIISIVFRPVSLSLRLFGNIYAGENLLHTMFHLGDPLPAPIRFLLSVVVPIPFYFLEILVAVIQALVFTLLCAVYIQLSTAHEEGEHGPAHDTPDAAHPPASGRNGKRVAARPVAAHP